MTWYQEKIQRRTPKQKRLTRHELQMEIRILTGERNTALWERDRMKKTVEDLVGLMELSTSGMLMAAVEIVDNQFNRDGDAFDVPRSLDTVVISSPI